MEQTLRVPEQVVKKPAPHTYTPPLGHKALTPLYDVAIAVLTRERSWRSALVKLMSPAAQDVIVDVGSGTGSLAKRILSKEPACSYLGIDPDTDALTRARRKLSRQSTQAKFIQGFLNIEQFEGRKTTTKIVSSLVLHQVPLEEKSRILSIMQSVLIPGGSVYIADYGLQSSRFSKTLFRLTVQSLDGTANTQANADGLLPELMKAAGFVDVIEDHRIPTLTGVISIYKGIKPSVSRMSAQ